MSSQAPSTSATPSDLPSKTKEIAEQCLYDPKHSHIQLGLTEHRIALASQWPIFSGAKVLELGCGQGDCTAVLAEMVGPEGHITAVDPADLSYGGPFTIGQAQAHISAGKYGSRITWVQDDPLHLLQATPENYDIAVLAHSLWFFSSTQVVVDTLRLLATRTRMICIAEWSLCAGSAGVNAAPHVLTALCKAALECHKSPERTLSNIRTLLSPARIKTLAAQVGLKVQSEVFVTPAENVLHGKWEVDMTMHESFLKDVEEFVKDEREREVVLAMRDAVEASVDAIGGRKYIRAMDVWCATLVCMSA